MSWTRSYARGTPPSLLEAATELEAATTVGLRVAPLEEVDGYLGGSATSLSVTLTSAPSSATEAEIDAWAAAHAGTPVPTPTLVALYTLPDAVLGIGWGALGGAVIPPALVVPDLSTMVWRVAFQLKSTSLGPAPQIRLRESIPGGASTLLSDTINLPDTGGVWQLVTFDTVTPCSPSPVGQPGNVYELEGQLNGATTAQIADVTVCMMRMD